MVEYPVNVEDVAVRCCEVITQMCWRLHRFTVSQYRVQQTAELGASGPNCIYVNTGCGRVAEIRYDGDAGPSGYGQTQTRLMPYSLLANPAIYAAVTGLTYYHTQFMNSRM